MKINKKYFCRNFPSRIGRQIGKIDGQMFICTEREKLHTNFKDCPLNKPEWGPEIND